MTARSDLFETVEAAENDIDAIFRPLGSALRRSVERHAVNGVITDDARRAILRDVDALLETVYGRRRGEIGPLGEAIIARANEARRKPVAAEIERMERLLQGEPALLERMKRG